MVKASIFVGIKSDYLFQISLNLILYILIGFHRWRTHFGGVLDTNNYSNLYNFDLFITIFLRQVRVLDDHIKTCVDWWEFVETMNKTNLLLSPFCGQSDCEEQIKAKSDCDEPEKALGIKIVCIPFEQVNAINNELFFEIDFGSKNRFYAKNTFIKS